MYHAHRVQRKLREVDEAVRLGRKAVKQSAKNRTQGRSNFGTVLFVLRSRQLSSLHLPLATQCQVKMNDGLRLPECWPRT